MVIVVGFLVVMCTELLSELTFFVTTPLAVVDMTEILGDRLLE